MSDPPAFLAADGPQLAAESRSASFLVGRASTQPRTHSASSTAKGQAVRSTRRRARREHREAAVSTAWEALVNTFAECYYTLRQDEEGLHPLSPPLLDLPAKKPGVSHHAGPPPRRQGLLGYHGNSGATQLPALPAGPTSSLVSGEDRRTDSRLALPDAPTQGQSPLLFGPPGGMQLELLALENEGQSHPADLQAQLMTGQLVSAIQNLDAPSQLLRVQRRRQGVLSEAEILDGLTNQKVAEIQYEFAARNGEVDVAEFIHILMRQLGSGQQPDSDRLPDSFIEPQSALKSGTFAAACKADRHVAVVPTTEGYASSTRLSVPAYIPAEATESGDTSLLRARLLSSSGARRRSLVSKEREQGRALSLVGDAGDEDRGGSWVRARGSVAALQDYHETLEQELAAGGRLMELFDLIDVDDAQKISWEAFTTFIVDRGRNEDALRRLHMQRLEKADLCDSRLHLSPIERLAPACDPAIGLDVIFYYEEHSKTVELISPQLLLVANQPPLQHQFNITAIAYCPLVHHLVVAAADLSLTFYDMRCAMTRQSSRMDPRTSTGRNRSPKQVSASSNSRETSPVGRATLGRPLGDDPWRVTRTFKTRTSQIVLFPSVSRPWLYSADHEGSLYAWDLELICSAGSGLANGGAIDNAGDNNRVRGAVGEAIDLGGLVPSARFSSDAMSLHLPPLSGSYGSSNYTLSSTRQLPASSHSAGSAGRSQQFSGRSSDKGHSAPGAGQQLGGAQPGKRHSSAGKHLARRASAQTKTSSRNGFFTSEQDGVSLFDSFTGYGRPSIVLGSRHSHSFLRHLTGDTSQDTSPPTGPLSKHRPPSPESNSRGKGLRAASASSSAADAAGGISRPPSSAFSASRAGAGLDGTLSATDLSSLSDGSNTLKGSTGRLRPQRSPSVVSSVPSSAGAGPYREKEFRHDLRSHYRTGDSRITESGSSARSPSLARGGGTNSTVPGWGAGLSSPKCRGRVPQNSQGFPGEGPQSGVSTTRMTVGGSQPRNGCHSPSGGGSDGGSVPQEPQAHLMRWRQFRAHGDIVTAFEELEAMDLLATCGMDAKIYLWELATGELKRTLDGHARGVKALCFDAPNRVLLSGGFDYKLVAWNPYVGKKLHTIRGHSAPVVSICMLGANSRQFVSFDSEGIIKTWDLSTSACLQTLVTEELPLVRAVVALPEHNALLCAGRKLIALTHGLVQDSSTADESGNTGTRSGAKGQGTGSGRLSFSGQQLVPTAVSSGPAGKHRSPPGGLSLEGDGGPFLVKAVAHLVVRVLVTAGGRHLRVWDLCTGALVSSIEHVCKGAEHAISDVCLDEKGRKVFVADQSGCVCAYSVCTGQLIQRFSSHGAEVSQILYAEGGDRNLISVSWDRSIVVHDDGPCNVPVAPQKTPLDTAPAGGVKGGASPHHTSELLAMEWPSSRGASSPCVLRKRQGGDNSEGNRGRPKGRSLDRSSNGIAGAEGRDRAMSSTVFSPSRRKKEETVNGGHCPRRVSPDTLLAAPGKTAQKGRDNKIWRMVKNAHLGDVTCCSFSRRSGLLATGGADCAIFVWEYERLRRVTSLFGHKHDLSALSFIDPLPFLCSADVGGTICIWVLPPHPHAIRVLETLPSPVLGPQAASTLLASMTGVSLSSGSTNSPLGENMPGNLSLPSSHGGESLGDMATYTGGTSAKLSHSTKLTSKLEGPWLAPEGVESDTAGEGSSGGGHDSFAGSGGRASSHLLGGDGDTGERTPSCGEKASSSLRTAPGQKEGENTKVAFTSPTRPSPSSGSGGGGRRSNLRSAAGMESLSSGAVTGGERTAGVPRSPTTTNSFSSGLLAAATGGLPVTLLLVRLVDMEKVSETTPLTALASFCRLHNSTSHTSTPNNSGRSIRFAEGPTAASTCKTKRSWTGSATPSPLNSPRERAVALSSSSDKRQAAGERGEGQETIPPTPHTTTFLTTTDGSEPPGEEGCWRPCHINLRSPQQGGGGLHQPMRSRLVQRTTDNGGGECENGGRGEILVFAGDEKGRLRVWDVSILLSLLRETGPVTPKADWQPHRVYREDLRENTLSLFRQVAQQQQNLAKHMNGEAVASSSVAVTFLPQQNLPGGSATPGGSGGGGWCGRQWSARPLVRQSAVGEDVIGNGDIEKRTAPPSATTGEAAEISGELLDRHARSRGATSTRTTRTGPKEEFVWEGSARFSFAPPFRNSGTSTPGVAPPSPGTIGSSSSSSATTHSPYRRDSYGGISAFSDTRNASKASDGILRGTAPSFRGKQDDTATMRKKEESTAALSVVNRSRGGSDNERGRRSFSSSSSASSASSPSLPSSGVLASVPHFQQHTGHGLYGDSNTIVSDPILAYENIPALFPKAPVKLIGLWKAHKASVRSLQFLALSKPKSSTSVRLAGGEEGSPPGHVLEQDALSKARERDETGEAADQDPAAFSTPPPSMDPRCQRASAGKEEEPSFRNLLVSGGAEGAVRVWDVTGFSPSNPSSLGKSLPTLFLDLAQQERNALRGHRPGTSVSGRSRARTTPKGGGTEGYASHSPQTSAIVASSSHPFLKENCLLAPAVSSSCLADPATCTSMLQSLSLPLSGCEIQGEPSSSLLFSLHSTPRQYPVILLGDLQTNTTGRYNPRRRGANQKQNSPFPNELNEISQGSSSILWNVDLGDYDYYAPGGFFVGGGSTDSGGGVHAPTTAAANAKRLVETHMRVKQLEHEQQLADEQQQAHLHLVGASLKDFHIPSLLALELKEQSEGGDGQKGKDAPRTKRSARTQDGGAGEHSMTAGVGERLKGNFILGGNTWVKGGDKGGGVWAAVYAKRQSIVERTASF